ncbi:carbohydrate ABC transporter permease [Streptomyces aidingensis]|uniref:Cellobiose transport system permease protein n=1 Tax=Streptomyces aidingensis TaxID=910347 RepID=A0A1I1RIN4_9ACTN|nr:sugar ABC transporter permease [Streptomyces aidingensis]SFD34151.1 cellobiose transport system permease protein [Streptomyces aidingensis]
MTTEHHLAAPPSGGAAPRQERPPGRGRAARKALDPKAVRRRSLRYRLDTKFSPYGFISPFFLFFAAFGLFPLLFTGWAALHRVQLHNPTDMEWAGLHNFTRLLEDEFFWNSLKNTFLIGMISTVPQLLMALGLAHLLNYKLRASNFWRVALLTPYATSVAAATLVFALLYGRDYGMINWALGLVGIDNIDWQSGDWVSKFAVSTIVIWRWTGYNTLIYLAAMQAVPSDLYESAAIDGASRWKQFLYVTIPSLRPTILFTIVVSTIGAMQLFGEPLLFGSGADGGPSHQFQTIGLYMYQIGWFNFNLGRASAIAWAMFLILILIGLINWGLTKWVNKSSGIGKGA